MKLVIKLGGALLDSTNGSFAFLKQIVEMSKIGHKIILVHGGGKQISQNLSRFGIASKFVQGLRVTDYETLQVVLMTLGGLINKQLVQEVSRLGGKAIGICGGDGHAIVAKKLELKEENGDSETDLGYVGHVVHVDGEFFEALFDCGFIPIVASIASTDDHQYLNVNADQMAAACASGIKADGLIYLTDVPGVLNKEGQVIRRLSLGKIESLIKDGTISGGMLPKLRSCRQALENGVAQVCITTSKGINLWASILRPNFMPGTSINV